MQRQAHNTGIDRETAPQVSEMSKTTSQTALVTLARLLARVCVAGQVQTPERQRDA